MTLRFSVDYTQYTIPYPLFAMLHVLNEYVYKDRKVEILLRKAYKGTITARFHVHTIC